MNEHAPALRPDLPAAPAYDPASLTLYAPTPAAVELAAERGPVVWVPDAYGRMVPMAKHLAPPPMARPSCDLTPLPLLDPVAQRFLGAGLWRRRPVRRRRLRHRRGHQRRRRPRHRHRHVDRARGPRRRTPVRAISGGRGSTVNIRKAVIKRNHFHG